VYTDITLETVALHGLNNVAVFVTDAPAKSIATNFPLSKGLSLNTITTECKQMEEHSVLLTQILHLNVLMFPLFCPPSVSAENQTWQIIGTEKKYYW
jgi:hypothetical protein